MSLFFTVETVDAVGTVYNIQTTLHCLNSSKYANISL